jgi:PEP-CTERM motif-containing protein
LAKNAVVAVGRGLAVAVAVLFIASSATASIVTFSAQDDGAPVGGPFPNSSAMQSSFLAAAGALGSLNTIDFEGLPDGYTNPLAAAPGVSVSLTSPDYGNQFSGISSGTLGNLYGFNTTPGGSKWLGSPNGSTVFSFGNPTQSFGVWLTGVQTVFTSVFQVKFNDGSSQTLNIPINTGGGAQFFGFTDAGRSISAVTITNVSSDAWGIDDVTYNVPEPTSLILLGGGILGLARARRKRA